MTKSSWGISDVGRLERHQGKVEKERPGLVVTHYDFTSFLKRLRYEVLLSVSPAYFGVHVGGKSPVILSCNTLVPSQVVSNHLFLEVIVVAYDHSII